MIIGLGILLIITSLSCIFLIWHNLNLRIALKESLSESEHKFERIRHYAAHELRAPLIGMGRIIDWLILDYSTQLGVSGINQLKGLKSNASKMDLVLDDMVNCINTENKE